MHAIVGGTVSIISGGKFANGAATGAFQAALSGLNEAQGGLNDVGGSATKANPKLGARASAAANKALREAGAFRVYATQGGAEDSWAAVVGPLQTKYGVEIGSLIYQGPRGFVLGLAYSSGNPHTILGLFDQPLLRNVAKVGFIHTHPTGSLFSGMDSGVNILSDIPKCFSGGRANGNCGGDLETGWSQGIDASVVLNNQVTMRWDYQQAQAAATNALGGDIRLGDYAR